MYRIHTWLACILCLGFVSSQSANEEKNHFLTSDDELVRQLFELEYRPEEKQLTTHTTNITTCYPRFVSWTTKATALIALWYSLDYLYRHKIQTT